MRVKSAAAAAASAAAATAAAVVEARLTYVCRDVATVCRSWRRLLKRRSALQLHTTETDLNLVTLQRCSSALDTSEVDVVSDMLAC